MVTTIDLQNFIKILKEIKTDGKKIRYEINPFFSSFITTELENKGIPVTDDEINKKVIEYLFKTFETLQVDDKLLILFSYVLLNNFLEDLDSKDKEGVLKVIENKDISKAEHNEYRLLLNLDVVNIEKSVIFKVLSFQLEEEYKQINKTQRETKQWIIKRLIYFGLSTITILVLLFLIPKTHDYLFGDNLEHIATHFGEIMKLILLSK